MKQIILLSLGFVAVLSCNTSNNNQHTMDNHSQHTADHATVSSSQYYMELSSDPKQVISGKPAQLIFTPKIEGNPAVRVTLTTEHEKQLHIIIVSEDLSYFEHIHPELQPNGSYAIHHIFPAGGTYLIYADYKPIDAEQVVDNKTIYVAGNPVTSQVFHDERLTASSGNYTLTLQTEEDKLIANQDIYITGILQENGREIDVNAIGNYLGTKAHAVIISLESKSFLHVHPSVKDGRLQLHAFFKTPGIYRAWIQFQNEDSIYTTDYVLKVVMASASEKANSTYIHQGHTHHH